LRATRQHTTGRRRELGIAFSAPRKSNIRESSKRTLHSTRSTPPSTCFSASATEYAAASSSSPPIAARAASTTSWVPATSTRRTGAASAAGAVRLAALLAAGNGALARRRAVVVGVVAHLLRPQALRLFGLALARERRAVLAFHLRMLRDS